MLCPKCRQPIEGSEVYICCGTEKLEWRCGDCGKVSEGFAFPYGLCPLCNGKLEILGSRRLEDREALDAVRTAFEIELGGRAFYSRAKQETQEKAFQELFAKLADMEEEHMDTLSRRYHAQIPTHDEVLGVERAAIFAGIDSHPEDPVNLLNIAVACEERAANFFKEKSRQMPEDSPARELYRELAAEEQEHADLLSTELERWKAGKAGLL